MKNWNPMSVLFYATAAAAAFILVASTLVSTVQSVALNNEELTVYNSGWQVAVDDKNFGTMDLPAILPAEKNDVVYLTNTIPLALKQNSTLFFRTAQSHVKVLADGQLLHSFGWNDDLVFGSVSGSAWQVIRIPPECFGKQLSIEIVSPYGKYSGIISDFYIGTKASILFHIIEQSMLRLVLCFLIFIVGFAMLVLYFFARKSLENKGWLYLGYFSLLLGLWALGETRLLQFFLGNTFFVTNLVMLSQMVLPIPFCLFLDTFSCYHSDRVIRLGVVVFSVNFAVCTTLQLLNIRDFFVMLNSTHALIVLFVVYSVVKFIFHFRRNKDQETAVLAIATVTMLFSVLLDVVVFYLFAARVDTIFTRLGFLLFITIVGGWMGQRAIVLHSQRIERETLSALAYTDILTKLGNRAAFETCMDLYRGDNQTNSVCIIMLDLNNLKLVNDTYGHSAGDRMIVQAAQLIDRTFSDIGKCFRIGGDEFCVICPHVEDSLLAERFSAFRHAMCAEKQDDLPMGLSIAYGYARYLPGDSASIDAVLVDADRNMYLLKEQMKAQSHP